MNRIVLRIAVILLPAFLLLSCEKGKDGNSFRVEGTISGAEGKMLYFESSNRIRLDSVTLDNEGRFLFTSPAQADFYQLKLDRQIIHFVADSTETIEVTAQAPDVMHSYTITGSAENRKIKELSLLRLNTMAEYRKLQSQFNNKEITADDYVREANSAINDYKAKAREYILAGFDLPSAYFALFQQIDSLMIFDPYDKEDLKLFGALANNYPDSARREQIKKVFLNGMITLRGEQQPLDVNEVDSSTLFDLLLPSTDGKEVRLSEAGKDKLTLVEFTAYGAAESPVHNILLAEIYNKYRSRGFEIYQVSLDPDEHQWLNAAVNLPWIKVRDPQSVYSPNVQKYNVSGLPTAFLRDKTGEIVERIENYEQLETLVRKHLK